MFRSLLLLILALYYQLEFWFSLIHMFPRSLDSFDGGSDYPDAQDSQPPMLRSEFEPGNPVLPCRDPTGAAGKL